MDAIEALKACPLFHGFTDTGLSIFASVLLPRSIAQGELLFEEGAPGSSLEIIASGTVRLHTRSQKSEKSKKPQAREAIELGCLGPGGYLGEVSLVEPGVRACTATALEDVVVLELSSEAFTSLLGAKPQACAKLLLAVVAQLAHKLAEARDDLKGLAGKP